MLTPHALIGTVVDQRYRLHTFLGNGAFGFVFGTDELALGEVIGEAAVKLIRPQSDKHRSDILHEIRAMSRLSHPNLLGYRSAGEVRIGAEPLIFLATELAQGTLEDTLAQGTLSLDATLDLARDLASALGYLTEREIVHRDLKPANVLRVGPSWKVADFGLVRVAGVNSPHLTSAAGTLVYMSPEAIDGEVSPCVDIWALGVMLQECLSGRFPYPPDTQLQFIRSVATREPYIEPGLPQPFDAIVKGCLTKDGAQRWTTRQVLAALSQASALGQSSPSLHLSTVTPNVPTSLPIAPLPVASPPAQPRIVAPVLNTTLLPPQTNDLVVAAAGDGTHRTLSEALADASPHTRIFVRPGIYRNPVRIDKPIQIFGEGDRDNIIIEGATANCLKLEATERTASIVVRGLTLRGTARTIGKKYFTVSVSRGYLTLEDCVIMSDSLACIAAQSEAATLHLNNCHVMNGANDGVLFSDGAQGTLQNCVLTAHKRHGLQIKTGAQITARSCTLSSNGGCGLFVSEGGCGTLEGCEIIDNAKAGVTIGPEGAPHLLYCLIRGNKQQAVSAERGSRGIIEACDLRHNAFGAWDIASGTLLERRNNKD